MANDDDDDELARVRSASPGTIIPTDDDTVFVGGINWKATERDLLEFFNDQIGPALHCRIIANRETNRSKGYGFVTFANSALAMAAKASEPLIFMGKTLNCHDAYRRWGGAGMTMEESAPPVTRRPSRQAPRMFNPYDFTNVYPPGSGYLPPPFMYMVQSGGCWYPAADFLSHDPSYPTGGYIVNQPRFPEQYAYTIPPDFQQIPPPILVEEKSSTDMAEQALVDLAALDLAATTHPLNSDK